jgi:hypothetical protein
MREAAQEAGIDFAGLYDVKSLTDVITPHSIKELRCPNKTPG